MVINMPSFVPITRVFLVQILCLSASVAFGDDVSVEKSILKPTESLMFRESKKSIDTLEFEKDRFELSEINEKWEAVFSAPVKLEDPESTLVVDRKVVSPDATTHSIQLLQNEETHSSEFLMIDPLGNVKREKINFVIPRLNDWVAQEKLRVEAESKKNFFSKLKFTKPHYRYSLVYQSQTYLQTDYSKISQGYVLMKLAVPFEIEHTGGSKVFMLPEFAVSTLTLTGASSSGGLARLEFSMTGGPERSFGAQNNFTFLPKIGIFYLSTSSGPDNIGLSNVGGIRMNLGLRYKQNEKRYYEGHVKFDQIFDGIVPLSPSNSRHILSLRAGFNAHNEGNWFKRHAHSVFFENESLNLTSLGRNAKLTSNSLGLEIAF